MKKIFLDNFVLKLIAIVAMTFDHIGVFLYEYSMESEVMQITSLAFRIIGRIALPLFVLFAVEGALKSKNVPKYILRLALIGLPIIIAQVIMELMTQFGGYSLSFKFGNIFISLILIVVMIYCFENKNKWVKLSGLIPIIIAAISFGVTGYEFAHTTQGNITTIWWFPHMLRPQYDIIAISLGLMFYLATKFIKIAYQNQGLNPELYKDQENYQFGTNLFMILGLVIVCFLTYSLTWAAPQLIYWDQNAQLFALVAGLLILFYNGKRGYNKKWFRICSYLYYPVHLVVIYFIFLLIFM